MKQIRLLALAGMLFCITTITVNAQTSTWNGSASQWTNGNGTQSNPYLIENAAHLAYLSQQVVIGQKFAGEHFKLMTNINLKNIEWLPIGGRDMQGNEYSSNYFNGIFDGNNKTISNLKITASNKDYTGLFGVVTAEIRNLAVISGTVSGSSYTAGVVGRLLNGRIINCSNAADITVESDGAGVVGFGYRCEIINCTNSGNVFSGYSYGDVAGIVVTVDDCLIQNCTNNGTITGDYYVSGIVGRADGYIINCTNNGNVTGNYIAGIVREEYLSDGVIVSCCVNNGNLTSTGSFSSVGGIGSDIRSDKSVINNCYNTGAMNHGGGIVGEARKCRIENCYNVGIISSSSGSGAIVDELSDNATVSNCYYLNTSISTNNGYGNSRTSANMKTGSFVTMLNASQNPAPWKIGGSQNNGYPILVSSPYVKTIAATDITGASATLHGYIEKGDEPITSQGFKYKKYGTTNYTTVNVSGNSLSSNISCEPLSGYLFQTFATTMSGTYYGEELSFTTTNAVAINDIEPSDVKIYPNPAHNNITLECEEQINNIEITDMLGKIVYHGKETTIDISHLANGNYLIKITTDRGIITKKILVQ
ncbi:MAG: T9SS type A sorting domain-containing protein [Bacteroidales bacterium]|jgi:hypothetical protein|nr:T9SS type A sorting domain-containing protein [Bacteroidales bacterium]